MFTNSEIITRKSASQNMMAMIANASIPKEERLDHIIMGLRTKDTRDNEITPETNCKDYERVKQTR